MARNYCRKCGGELRRIHRTFREKLRYSAVFECAGCQERFGRSRRPQIFLLGPAARCPKCGSYRLAKLQTRDRIDPMYRAILSLAQQLFASSRIYHCRICRIQFWDRRPLKGEAPKDGAAELAANRT
jgi:DNA-directed RNA polymerase subunit RPC12/RpoP